MVRRELDESSPADAPTAYYTLYHDPARSSLYTQHDDDGTILGFLALCQTGIDLFRPLVTLQSSDAEAATEMLINALTPQRPYILFVKLGQLPYVSDHFDFDQHRTLHLYRLDPRRFIPAEINILVQHRSAPDGTPRAVIESGEQPQAVAGVNWQSPQFAELYVQVEEDARRRGWGVSVASTVTQAVLESGRIPLYLVEDSNEASVELALKLGYVDTGARQVFAHVVYTGR